MFMLRFITGSVLMASGGAILWQALAVTNPVQACVVLACGFGVFAMGNGLMLTANN